MSTSQKNAARLAGFRIEKNPTTCLVYDVWGTGRKTYTRDTLRKEILKPERALPKRLAKKESVIKICGDGDSWINILYPYSSIFGYQKTFFDVLQDVYPSTDVAWPGDTFQQMLLEKDYRAPIGSATFDYFIFSGGGNDVLGGGALVNLLRWKDEARGSSDPKAYVYGQLLRRVLEVLRSGYLEIAADVRARSSGRTHMLVHGYDYPIPRADGIWLGRPFQAKGYSLQKDKALIAAVLKHLVDEFYGMLESVARRSRNVTVVELRNSVKGRWHDELHPRQTASQEIAGIYRRIIEPGVFS